MDASSIGLLLLAVVASAAISYYQYFFRVESRSKTHLLLAFLRFVGVLGLLLLLVNPRITRTTYEERKTPLPVVVDNSASIADLKADKTARALYEKLSGDRRIRERFEVQPYQFDRDMNQVDTLDFKGPQSDLEEVAKSLKSINRNRSYPVVLISDGNQTEGNDYVYAFDTNAKVYPLVLGDTTQFLDLRIAQLNVNRYAFHKNQFPVEVFLQYSGTKSVSASFSVAQGNNVLNKQTVDFSPQKRSAVVNLLLPADKTGLQVFRAQLTSKESEKNTYNNVKQFAIEVIDQRSEIALVAKLNHPDLGALKRSIETNQQRKVTILKPGDAQNLQGYNVVILYQPDANFRSVYEALKKSGTNTFIITGGDTDFNLLNQQQSALEFRMTSQREDYLATYEPQFNLFAVDDIGFASFPPLQQPFGTVKVKGNVDVLLKSNIRNIDTGMPLLCFSDDKGKRTAFLLGENFWKWRLQYHVDHNDFEKFDVFTDKIIQFLASNDTKKSLVVNHERFYNSGDAIEITAQYFNKNYEFDEKARLSISLTNRKTKKTTQYDMVRGGNAFKVNLDGFAAGPYSFTVKESNSGKTYSAGFEILDFDIEKQFVNPDYPKLKQLAAQTKGQTFLPQQADALIESLLTDASYKSIEKAITRRIPLIDFTTLLVLIAAAFGAEWFIRKYNGMV
ncbi:MULTISPECIES: hypothetical protein [unclassified Flavobacterium]|uniref:hypothetical protein n=1 Tax=unclassified Flavobacterium TaxID=196869 RepID=UPI001F13926E|nr:MULTISPECIES: hypothetical protein [unclassified Flavobacterium]UMY64631.1 hypothetical protein MKO97_08915 [Flavobacterium sp. HJ-32-4]